MLHKIYKSRKFVRTSFLLMVFSSVLIAPVYAQNNAVEIEYNFKSGSLGWTADFADYNPSTNQSGFYELSAGIRLMPRKLTRVQRRGFYIQGNNHSSDLFMFLKRRLGVEDGIVAGRTYRIEYVITLASNAPSGCGGIGGSPGESVFLKAGGSSIEPLALLKSNGSLRMNVDKGNQSQSGPAASVAGNVANGIPCNQALPLYPFALIVRSHQHTTNVTANANGELWLLVGTDSGFEGITRIYYQSIRVRLVPVQS